MRYITNDKQKRKTFFTQRKLPAPLEGDDARQEEAFLGTSVPAFSQVLHLLVELGAKALLSKHSIEILRFPSSSSSSSSQKKTGW